MGSPVDERHRKTLIAVLAAASSFMLFMTTESCFEEADRRNATTLVQHLRTHPEAQTILEALLNRHREATQQTIRWHATLTDNYYGFVRVSASVPTSEGEQDYLFDVNLAGQRIHPANDSARELMVTLGHPEAPKQPSAP